MEHFLHSQYCLDSVSNIYKHEFVLSCSVKCFSYENKQELKSMCAPASTHGNVYNCVIYNSNRQKTNKHQMSTILYLHNGILHDLKNDLWLYNYMDET
jgi:hypothetical protein